jgi:hypothetical protein
MVAAIQDLKFLVVILQIDVIALQLLHLLALGPIVLTALALQTEAEVLLLIHLVAALHLAEVVTLRVVAAADLLAEVVHHSLQVVDRAEAQVVGVRLVAVEVVVVEALLLDQEAAIN